MESHRGESSTYRLIVMRRSASEILLVPTGAGLGMPRLIIQPCQRVAEQLTVGLSRVWGVEGYCLMIRSLPTCSRDGEPRWAILESVQQNDAARTGAVWVPRGELDSCVGPDQAQVIWDSLKELNASAKNEESGPFSRPGWLRDLFHWTQEQIAPLGLRLTGAFQQLNASPVFSLIRMETQDRAVWFKATGAPNSHELRVTVALARIFPASLPQILGVHPGWNGWLAAEAEGTPLYNTTDFAAWQHTAEKLAQLQIASIEKTAKLRETAQLRDLRLPTLAKQIGPFLSRMSELMSAQEKLSPAPLARSELRTLAEGLEESCALLARSHFPDALGHIDLSPGNVLVSGDRCVFLDWAEGCISHPLMTFEYLRTYLDRTGIENPAASERLTAAYLRPWIPFYSSDELRREMALSPLVAVFVYAVANDSWRSPDLFRDASRAAYFRGLTRRMYREAIKAARRSELCLS